MEKGPQMRVPRIVWQLSFGAFFLLALVPVFIMLDQIPYRANTTFVQDLARIFVPMVYGIGVINGANKAMNWLFGPKPAHRRDRNNQAT